MKEPILITLITLVFLMNINAQVTGMWKITDEKDNVEKSIVEIFELNNYYYGRVARILPASKRTHCENCIGDQKNKPLLGMIIIADLIKNTNGGTDGKVLNPATGKWYSCYIDLVSSDRLKLRGYMGVPAFGKTMYWNRLK